MDKNIAAMIQNNTKTILVRFPQDRGITTEYLDKEVRTLLGDDGIDLSLSAKTYRYVTTLDVQVGDIVIVPAVGEYKLVYVCQVDDDLLIEPNEDIQYKWVVSKVDFTHFKEQMAKNLQIQKTLSKAYKKNARQQARAIMFASLPEQEIAQLTSIIGE